MGSPTDELRARLNELGVEHYDNDANMEVTGVRYTKWKNGGRREVRYEEWRNGTTRLDAGNVSPEQAIAATVGAGTCHMEVKDNLAETEGMGEVWLECDRCHWQMPLEPTTPRFKHCPNCGKRIKED